MKVKSPKSRVNGQSDWNEVRHRTLLAAGRFRRGLTLIELLVVIILLTTLVAAAIPILAPAGNDRANREATRGLNTFITGAQSRAVALRRPFGIALKRLSQDTRRMEDNGVCLEVYYVEQQPPYSGFDPNSRACVGINRQLGLSVVRFVCPGDAASPNDDWLPVGWDADLFPNFTIRPGDVIEIGTTRYRLSSAIQDPRAQTQQSGTTFYNPSLLTRRMAVEIQVVPMNDTGQLLNTEFNDAGYRVSEAPPLPVPPNTAQRKYFWTAPMPYRILRQPTMTSDPPYQLPEGVAIDLRASGFGRDRFFQYPPPNLNASTLSAEPRYVDNDQPVVIMFTPEGRVERVRFDSNVYNANFVAVAPIKDVFDEPVVDNVFLMLGRRENIPAPAVADDVTLALSTWSALATDQERQEARAPVNWLNADSRWIVIGSQSGRVVSIENAFVDPGALVSALGPGEPLRTAQILAARRYTSEMANVGGR